MNLEKPTELDLYWPFQDAAESNGIKLIPGAGQDLKLGSLRALQSDNPQPDSFTLHLDGKPNIADAPIEVDQEKFNVGITVKVVNAGN